MLALDVAYLAVASKVGAAGIATISERHYGASPNLFQFWCSSVN